MTQNNSYYQFLDMEKRVSCSSNTTEGYSDQASWSCLASHYPTFMLIGLRISILRCRISSCSVVHYSVIKWIFGRWCCSMFLLRCMWKSSQYPQCCPMWDWNPQYLATYKPSRWPPSLGHTLSFKIIPLQFAKCNFIRVIGGKFFAALRYFFFKYPY